LLVFGLGGLIFCSRLMVFGVASSQLRVTCSVLP
jgi:hypothetical protein